MGRYSLLLINQLLILIIIKAILHMSIILQREEMVRELVEMGMQARDESNHPIRAIGLLLARYGNVSQIDCFAVAKVDLKIYNIIIIL